MTKTRPWPDVQLAAVGNDIWELRHAGQTWRVRVLHREGVRWYLEIEGQRVVVDATWVRGQGWAQWRGRLWRVDSTPRAPSARGEAEAPHRDGILRAPMPAQVRHIAIQPGDRVKAGATLVLLEAMKMELRIQAPFDAHVTAVHVQPGQAVERDAVLVELEPVTAGAE
ncbi:MAG: hypothetical protein GXO54_05615 [Chloroflexi bacterium]|nr:hypothetical protein [Chloroflexota bacterium]